MGADHRVHRRRVEHEGEVIVRDVAHREVLELAVVGQREAGDRRVEVPQDRSGRGVQAGPPARRRGVDAVGQEQDRPEVLVPIAVAQRRQRAGELGLPGLACQFGDVIRAVAGEIGQGTQLDPEAVEHHIVGLTEALPEVAVVDEEAPRELDPRGRPVGQAHAARGVDEHRDDVSTPGDVLLEPRRLVEDRDQHHHDEPAQAHQQHASPQRPQRAVVVDRQAQHQDRQDPDHDLDPQVPAAEEHQLLSRLDVLSGDAGGAGVHLTQAA